MLSPTVYHLWTILSLLLASFFLVHIYLFDRFQCFRWSRNGTSTFKRLMIYGYALSIPCIITFSIGFSIITSRYPSLYNIPSPSSLPPLTSNTTTSSPITSNPTTTAPVSPAVIAALLHLNHPAIIPLYIVFALGWALEISTHLEEFCFWLFLLSPPAPTMSIPNTGAKPGRTGTGLFSNRSLSRSMTMTSSRSPRRGDQILSIASPMQNPTPILNEKDHDLILGGERVESPGPYADHDHDGPSQHQRPVGWFSTVHFKIWFVGSLVALGALMTVVGVYAARNDPLKCEAATFMTGSILGLVLTLAFVPILYYFPQVIERSKNEGVEMEVIVRLVKFHELNVIRVFFRFLFLIPLLILAIDGINPAKAVINRNRLWSDLLAMMSGIGCIVSSALTILIFFPRSTEAEMTRAQQRREEKARRKGERSGRATRGMTTGTSGYSITERANSWMGGGLVRRLTFSDWERGDREKRRKVIEPFDLPREGSPRLLGAGGIGESPSRVQFQQQMQQQAQFQPQLEQAEVVDPRIYYDRGHPYRDQQPEQELEMEQQDQEQEMQRAIRSPSFSHPYSAAYYNPGRQRNSVIIEDEEAALGLGVERFQAAVPVPPSIWERRATNPFRPLPLPPVQALQQPQSPPPPISPLPPTPPPPATKPQTTPSPKGAPALRPPITTPGRRRPQPLPLPGRATGRTTPFPLTSHNLAMHTQMQVQAEQARRTLVGKDGYRDDATLVKIQTPPAIERITDEKRTRSASVGIASFRSPLDLLDQ